MVVACKPNLNQTRAHTLHIPAFAIRRRRRAVVYLMVRHTYLISYCTVWGFGTGSGRAHHPIADGLGVGREEMERSVVKECIGSRYECRANSENGVTARFRLFCRDYLGLYLMTNLKRVQISWLQMNNSLHYFSWLKHTGFYENASLCHHCSLFVCRN